MTAEKLQEILRKHTLWLRGDPDGEKADLSCVDLRDANLYRVNLYCANLSGANLNYVNLCDADLRGTNLCMTNLRRANLSGANLYMADLCNANLRDANLRCAHLCKANLYGANLYGANLSSANLRDVNLCMANLSDANLSGANGLLSAVNFMEAHFERTENGYIAYKTFGGQYTPPEKWKIEPGSVIEEIVNFDRCNDCGCGINVAPIQWVKNSYYKGDVWKVLIRWEWLAGVCVPYNTDGKIRCERVELIEIVK